MKKKKKRIIILAVVAAVIVIAIVMISQMARASASKMMEAVYQNYTVAKGTVETTITAGGQLSAEETENVLVPDGLTVTKLCVSAGDEVKAGAVLCELDPDSVRNQLIYAGKQATTSENHLGKSGTNDTITAPAQGRLKYQPAKVGDDVISDMLQYGALAILSTDGWMRLEVQTNMELTLGEKVIAEWDGGKAKAVVDKKVDGGYSILVPDDHAPYLVTAKVYKMDQEVGSGTLRINLPVEVYGFAGTIRKVSYQVDESVPDGRALFTLTNPPVSTGYAARYNERSGLADRYAALIRLHANPSVVAPCDGIISEIFVTQDGLTGKVDKADKDSIAFSIATGSINQLVVDVDELDIISTLEGLTAEVTFEALPNEHFSGAVTRVTKIGKKQNSISTYPVEITIEPDKRLLIGMNGTATILADRVENTLIIPINAISEDGEGTFVNVLAADGARVRTAITTGKSDGSMVEVTSGLSEGDVISYTLPGLTLADMYGGMQGAAVAME
ncbi:MAG: hypothetical protein RRZ24_03915 [Clostridia bacterium]